MKSRWEACGDVNWREHGGLWIRRVDAHCFNVVRLEQDEERSTETRAHYIIETATLDVRDCTRGDLRTIGAAPADDIAEGVLWDNGDLVRDPEQVQRILLDALIATWGVGSRGNEWTGTNAYRMLRQAGISNPGR